jgi:hypothetical protein
VEKPYKKPVLGQAQWTVFPGAMLALGVLFASYSVLWVLLGTALLFLLGLAIFRMPRAEA